ncbi:hypothetical protein GCM10017783_23240 [Deinococcus piscis]|uniref:DUF2171 domain-containing protein n=1 Tax=Deinococcus piscis TaxID=394230 RepID=A0ABQ3KA06_9DEIO|nr:DUF2171 domain-containing protein [Deinococcus piscis]GHG10091.1 hypothetical protein GCM10017783_23240 [Deinococcus piscis]
MTNTTHRDRITKHMPVFCAEGHHHGLVDHLDGDYIKLVKDEQGQHHWLPLSTVDHVDEHVHLNLNHQEVQEQWLSEDPHPQHRD